MNRLLTLQEEAKEVGERLGYYIPPYKYGELVKMKSKIVGLMVGPSAITMTYQEMQILLDMISRDVSHILGNEA